ncbi:hypothetical protein B0H16DRAFT_1720875 [Mycena metata]|uniref:F-box domain-containing protein n=1 Tax=Mycena metata TaxID=1033252 RepID=A0AAD7J869_9AGAR|nr:hypothetical protein B0H16DRAFT_1720875 [Mycena metata]
MPSNINPFLSLPFSPYSSSPSTQHSPSHSSSHSSSESELSSTSTGFWVGNQQLYSDSCSAQMLGVCLESYLVFFAMKDGTPLYATGKGMCMPHGSYRFLVLLSSTSKDTPLVVYLSNAAPTLVVRRGYAQYIPHGEMKFITKVDAVSITGTVWTILAVFWSPSGTALPFGENPSVSVKIVRMLSSCEEGEMMSISLGVKLLPETILAATEPAMMLDVDNIIFMNVSGGSSNLFIDWRVIIMLTTSVDMLLMGVLPLAGGTVTKHRFLNLLARAAMSLSQSRRIIRTSTRRGRDIRERAWTGWDNVSIWTFSFGADGGRRVQNSAFGVGEAPGFVGSGFGTAAADGGSALVFGGSSRRSGGALSHTLPQLVSPDVAFAFAFAGAFAPAVADTVFPSFATVLDCSSSDVHDDGLPYGRDSLPPPISFSRHHDLAAVRAADAQDASIGHGVVNWPSCIGHAGRCTPFIGTVCGITVWIEQTAALGLPNEILFQIMSDVTGPYRDAEPARHEHYTALFSLAATCRHWYTFLADCGGLWSSFCLTPHRLEASLEFWLSRIHHAPLDLRLYFDDLFALYHPRSTARAPRLGVRGTIGRIAPALSRCARLSIDAEATLSYPLLMRALGVASGRMLVSLAISRVYFAFLEDIVPPLDAAPNLFFRTGVPMLRFLRLCNATVGWGNLGFFERLEVLKLWGFRLPIGPTAVQLYTIISIAQYLVRLSLREVECDPLPPREHAFITCTFLVELDLHLSGTLGVPEVLSRCSFPALRKLSLILDAEFDLRCLLACSSLLGRVVVLTLQCYEPCRGSGVEGQSAGRARGRSRREWRRKPVPRSERKREENTGAGKGKRRATSAQLRDETANEEAAAAKLRNDRREFLRAQMRALVRAPVTASRGESQQRLAELQMLKNDLASLGPDEDIEFLIMELTNPLRGTPGPEDLPVDTGVDTGGAEGGPEHEGDDEDSEEEEADETEVERGRTGRSGDDRNEPSDTQVGGKVGYDHFDGEDRCGKCAEINSDCIRRRDSNKKTCARCARKKVRCLFNPQTTRVNRRAISRQAGTSRRVSGGSGRSGRSGVKRQHSEAFSIDEDGGRYVRKTYRGQEVFVPESRWYKGTASRPAAGQASPSLHHRELDPERPILGAVEELYDYVRRLEEDRMKMGKEIADLRAMLKGARRQIQGGVERRDELKMENEELKEELARIMRERITIPQPEVPLGLIPFADDDLNFALTLNDARDPTDESGGSGSNMDVDSGAVSGPEVVSGAGASSPVRSETELSMPPNLGDAEWDGGNRESSPTQRGTPRLGREIVAAAPGSALSARAPSVEETARPPTSTFVLKAGDSGKSVRRRRALPLTPKAEPVEPSIPGASGDGEETSGGNSGAAVQPETSGEDSGAAAQPESPRGVWPTPERELLEQAGQEDLELVRSVARLSVAHTDDDIPEELAEQLDSAMDVDAPEATESGENSGEGDSGSAVKTEQQDAQIPAPEVVQLREGLLDVRTEDGELVMTTTIYIIND